MQTADADDCGHGKNSCQKYQHRQKAALPEIEAEEVAADYRQDEEDHTAPQDAEEQSSKDQMVAVNRGDESVLDALGPHVE